MLKSLHTAEEAMRVQQLRIEALANNLANANATAFKRVLMQVTDKDASSPAPTAEQGDSGQRSGPRGLTGVTRPSDSLQLHTVMDPRPGPLRSTGNPTDLAVVGDGYFVVQKDESEYYTRDGSLHLDENGRLLTSGGHPLQGTGGPLTVDGESFTVERDGRVVVDGAVVGRVKVVDFGDPSRLRHVGHNLMTAPDDMPATNMAAEQVHVAQGQLEGSNVSPIDALIGMIAAQRAFEIASKVVQNADETLERSVNTLGLNR